MMPDADYTFVFSFFPVYYWELLAWQPKVLEIFMAASFFKSSNTSSSHFWHLKKKLEESKIIQKKAAAAAAFQIPIR